MLNNSELGVLPIGPTVHRFGDSGSSLEHLTPNTQLSRDSHERRCLNYNRPEHIDRWERFGVRQILAFASVASMG